MDAIFCIGDEVEKWNSTNSGRTDARSAAFKRHLVKLQVLFFLFMSIYILQD